MNLKNSQRHTASPEPETAQCSKVFFQTLHLVRCKYLNIKIAQDISYVKAQAVAINNCLQIQANIPQKIQYRGPKQTVCE